MLQHSAFVGDDEQEILLRRFKTRRAWGRWLADTAPDHFVTLTFQESSKVERERRQETILSARRPERRARLEGIADAPSGARRMGLRRVRQPGGGDLQTPEDALLQLELWLQHVEEEAKYDVLSPETRQGRQARPGRTTEAVKREAKRWIRRIEQRLSAKLKWFFAVERGAAGRLHLHVLTWGTSAIGADALMDAWPNGRAHAVAYDPAKGGAHYCTKSLGDEDDDYDLDLGE